MKYTRDDVIIWPDDKRLKGAVGKECYGANSSKEVLERANGGKLSATLIGIHPDGIETFEFADDIEVFSYSFLIIKKEPVKKIVPFDFSLKEDRDAVIGKCLIRKFSGHPDDEFMVVGFSENAACFPRDIVDIGNNALDHYGTGEELLKQFSFQDGKPVGKEVEE